MSCSSFCTSTTTSTTTTSSSMIVLQKQDDISTTITKSSNSDYNTTTASTVNGNSSNSKPSINSLMKQEIDLITTNHHSDIAVTADVLIRDSPNDYQNPTKDSPSSVKKAKKVVEGHSISICINSVDEPELKISEEIDESNIFSTNGSATTDLTSKVIYGLTQEINGLNIKDISNNKSRSQSNLHSDSSLCSISPKHNNSAINDDLSSKKRSKPLVRSGAVRESSLSPSPPPSTTNGGDTNIKTMSSLMSGGGGNSNHLTVAYSNNVNNNSSSNNSPIASLPTSSKNSSIISSDASSPSLSRDSSSEIQEMSVSEAKAFLAETLKKSLKDRQFLYKTEQDIQQFLKDPGRESLKIYQVSSYNRMLIHKTADYFQLEHSVDHTYTSVIVTKTQNTRQPDETFRDMISRDQEASNAPKKSILKRDSTSLDDSPSSSFDKDKSPDNTLLLNGAGIVGGTTVGAGSSLSDSSRSRSLEEREENYEKVRARIFSQQDSDSTTFSKDYSKSSASNSSQQQSKQSPTEQEQGISNNIENDKALSTEQQSELISIKLSQPQESSSLQQNDEIVSQFNCTNCDTITSTTNNDDHDNDDDNDDDDKTINNQQNSSNTKQFTNPQIKNDSFINSNTQKKKLLNNRGNKNFQRNKPFYHYHNQQHYQNYHTKQQFQQYSQPPYYQYQPQQQSYRPANQYHQQNQRFASSTENNSNHPQHRTSYRPNFVMNHHKSNSYHHSNSRHQVPSHHHQQQQHNHQGQGFNGGPIHHRMNHPQPSPSQPAQLMDPQQNNPYLLRFPGVLNPAFNQYAMDTSSSQSPYATMPPLIPNDQLYQSIAYINPSTMVPTATAPSLLTNHHPHSHQTTNVPTNPNQCLSSSATTTAQTNQHHQQFASNLPMGNGYPLLYGNIHQTMQPPPPPNATTHVPYSHSHSHHPHQQNAPPPAPPPSYSLINAAAYTAIPTMNLITATTLKNDPTNDPHENIHQQKTNNPRRNPIAQQSGPTTGGGLSESSSFDRIAQVHYPSFKQTNSQQQLAPQTPIHNVCFNVPPGNAMTRSNSDHQNIKNTTMNQTFFVNKQSSNPIFMNQTTKQATGFYQNYQNSNKSNQHLGPYNQKLQSQQQNNRGGGSGGIGAGNNISKQQRGSQQNAENTNTTNVNTNKSNNGNNKIKH